MATAASAAIPAGQVGRQETLSEWAGPYVTSMLGEAQALSQTPYQTYGGPLTAGPSSLQQQYFQGLGQIGFPSILGKSFSSAGAPTLPTMPTSGGLLGGFGPGGPQLTSDALTPEGRQMMESGRAAVSPVNTFPGPSAEDYFGARSQGMPAAQGIASQYMNPYLSSVLAPQLQAMQRQTDIQRNALGAQAAKSGAFGGARSGLMGQQLNAELMRQQQQATGQAYATAYDKAMQQFNTEQQQAMGLAGMLSGAGAQQRAIEAEGIAADKAEFEQQRDFPYKQLQFRQSMLQGMPIQSIAAQYQQPSTLASTMNTMGGLMQLYNMLYSGK